MSDIKQDNREQKDTAWRQGHLLPSACHDALGLSHESRYIVISHDCDLASDEQHVEVIQTSVREAADGNLRFGENPRVLHLTGELQGKELVLSLSQSEKHMVVKRSLFDHQPEQGWSLSSSAKAVLQSWLACRYARHALPNALNDRLKKSIRKLTDAAKSRHEAVIGVFIGFDPNEELEAEEPYEIELAVVYDSMDPTGPEKAAELVDRFKKALAEVEGVEFDDEKVRSWSDAAFTLRDMTRMMQLRLEFLSFRGEAIDARRINSAATAAWPLGQLRSWTE